MKGGEVITSTATHEPSCLFREKRARGVLATRSDRIRERSSVRSFVSLFLENSRTRRRTPPGPFAKAASRELLPFLRFLDITDV